jgi:hypothetical protein
MLPRQQRVLLYSSSSVLGADALDMADTFHRRHGTLGFSSVMTQ